MGKDTSAVMVGNGTILEPLAKASGSNYGIRVDVNAGASFSNGSQKRSGPIRVDASVQEAHLPPSVHAEGQLRIDVETREESPIR
jgi:shikimate kinase